MEFWNTKRSLNPGQKTRQGDDKQNLILLYCGLHKIVKIKEWPCPKSKNSEECENDDDTYF